MHRTRRARTSIIKEPPHVNGSFALFLLELLAALQQTLVAQAQRTLGLCGVEGKETNDQCGNQITFSHNEESSFHELKKRLIDMRHVNVTAINISLYHVTAGLDGAVWAQSDYQSFKLHVADQRKRSVYLTLTQPLALKGTGAALTHANGVRWV